MKTELYFEYAREQSDADTVSRFSESLSAISTFFASLPIEIRKKLTTLLNLETYFINEEICAQVSQGINAVFIRVHTIKMCWTLLIVAQSNID